MLDDVGSYVNGTWSDLADGPDAPLYFAFAALRDGRVILSGGEYNQGQKVFLLASEIYDPVLNTWEVMGTPKCWKAIGMPRHASFPMVRFCLVPLSITVVR
jgi:hypothetical protein